MAERLPIITNNEIAASPSENHGVEALCCTDLEVLSVGVSTGGIAEMRMALDDPDRHITATTIDASGLEFARKLIEESELSYQIDTLLQDVAEPLGDYLDNSFDFIYARLVLHYLPKKDLVNALGELYRVVKPGGRLFVVVRSTESHDVRRPSAVTDLETMLTTYTFTDPSTGKTKTFRRFFHDEESIQGYCEGAGFRTDYVERYPEQIYVDFMREQLASEPDEVIELMATKPVA